MVRRRKSAWRYGLGIILWPVKLMLVLTIGLFVRLAIGPVDVPVPESAVDALMASAAPGWRMETSGAEFDLFGQEGLTGLKLRDVRLMDEAGNEKATVPVLGLSMALSATDDINEAVAVRGVKLGGASIDVTRREDGSFSLGVGGLPALPAMQGGGAGDGDALAGLPKLSVSDARLNYRDPARGIDLTARSAKMTLDPEGRALFDATVVLDDGEPISLTVDATRSPDGAVALAVTFDDLDPAALAVLDPALASLADVRMVLGGTVLANVAADSTLESLTAELGAPGGGSVIVKGRAHRVERLAGTATYGAGRIAADITDFAISDAGLTVEGRASIRQDGDEEWTVGLSAPALAYVDTRSGNRAATGAIEAQGRFAGGIVRLDRISVAAPTAKDGARSVSLASLDAAGSFRPDNGVLTLDRFDGRKLDVALPDMPVRAERLAGNARIDTSLGIVTLSPVSVTALATAIDGRPVTLAGAELSARIDADAQSVTVRTLDARRLSVVLPEGKAVTVAGLQVEGSIAGQADGTLARALFDRLDANGIRVTLPEFYDAPLSVETLSLTSTITRAESGHSIALPRIDATIDGLPLSAQAAVTVLADGQARAKLTTTIGATPFARVPALWPRGVAPGGLKWVSKNVRAGMVTGVSLDATVDTADPSGDALLLKFGFEEGLVTAAPGLPPIRNGRGRGQVSLDRLDVFLDSGQVAVPATPGYALTESRFSIIDFKPKIPDGHIKLNVDGPVESILRFLDHEPLGLISKSGFDISTAKGMVSSKVQVKLPLAADLLVDDVDFRANADVRDFSLFEPHTGVPITGDTMAIAVAPDGLKFRSDARIDGLAARLNYSQGFSKPEPGEPEGELTLQSYLTREDFALRAGIDVSDYFDGVAVLDAKVDLFPGGGARFAADADLTGSILRIERLGWTKGDGRPATVQLRGFRNPDGAGQVEMIDARGTGIAATGKLSFDTANTVRLVEFDRIALADTLETSLRYSDGVGEAGKRIELSGDLLDLRVPFKEAMDATADDEVAPPAQQGEIIEIATDINTVRLRDDLAVAGLRGGIRLQGERINAAKIEGRVNGTGPALILAERRDDGLVLRLTSPDAGAFLGAASVFEGATGGQLRLDARTVDSVLPSRIAGRATIAGITVNNSETMREILAGGSIGSLVQQMLSGGLTFTKVDLPFTGVGGRWTITDGLVYGNALGLTLDGSYDIDREVMDLAGTVSPAYAINGALGAVPVLGTLLTGGEGEGVFGVTFAVRGPTEDPNVWVNPLSAIAPGFLRKIVSGVMDGQRTAQGRADDTLIQDGSER